MPAKKDERTVGEILQDLQEIESGLSPTEQDREMLGETPSLLRDIYGDVSKAITLHHYRAIISAQIDKAKSGDTSAAKFCHDLVEGSLAFSVAETTSVKWEELAIKMRDRLGLELSAEDMVIILLHYFDAMTEEEVGPLLERLTTFVIEQQMPS